MRLRRWVKLTIALIIIAVLVAAAATLLERARTRDKVELGKVLSAGRVPAKGWETTLFEGHQLTFPLILYPGAEIQAYDMLPAQEGGQDYVVLLGTTDTPAQVVKYYEKALRGRGIKMMTSEGAPQEYAMLSETPKNGKILQVFADKGPKGPPADLLNFLQTPSESTDETKITIFLPLPNEVLESIERSLEGVQ